MIFFLNPFQRCFGFSLRLNFSLNIKRLICVNSKRHASRQIQFCFFASCFSFFRRPRSFCVCVHLLRFNTARYNLAESVQNHFCNLFDKLTSNPLIYLRYSCKFAHTEKYDWLHYFSTISTKPLWSAYGSKMILFRINIKILIAGE